MIRRTIRGRDYGGLVAFFAVFGILLAVGNQFHVLTNGLVLPDFDKLSPEHIELIQAIESRPAGPRPTLAVAPEKVRGVEERPEFAIPGGRFFTQTSGRPGHGFAVTDDNGVRFWTEFQRLGGVDRVGYPISRRFAWDGYPTQAFQKMILQWRPENNRAVIVNALDLLHERGHDAWLLTKHGIPPLANWSGDAGRPFDVVVREHQALLTDPDIRNAYFASGDPMLVHGLPMAPIHQAGNVLTLRTQRGLLQKWLTETPWARAGQVTTANVGDLVKEAGLFAGLPAWDERR